MTETRVEEVRAHRNLINRLRGVYRIPITDGLGPAGGDEPDNPTEFVSHFETPPIHHEAAAALSALLDALTSSEERVRELEGGLRHLASLPLGAEIIEEIDLVLYANAGRSITVGDVLEARRLLAARAGE